MSERVEWAHERQPVKGEVWTFNGEPWTCIDDEPDVGGEYGWLLSDGGKVYDGLRGMTPPKPERPMHTKGWRAVWSYGLGGYAWDSPDDIHRDKDGDYLGALNLETGEWVPRP